MNGSTASGLPLLAVDLKNDKIKQIRKMTTAPGFYKTEYGTKAEVVDVRHGLAIGWINDHPHSWNLNGESTIMLVFNLVEPWVDAPKLRPWTVEEVPLGAWMREVRVKQIRMIINTMNEVRRKDWLDFYEHSTDGGKTWKPCGVEVKP